MWYQNPKAKLGFLQELLYFFTVISYENLDYRNKYLTH